MGKGCGCPGRWGVVLEGVIWRRGGCTRGWISVRKGDGMGGVMLGGMIGGFVLGGKIWGGISARKGDLGGFVQGGVRIYAQRKFEG